MRRFIVSIAVSLGFFTAPLAADAARPTDEVENCEMCTAVLDLAIANPRRTADRQRDRWRHPAETLSFFRVRPGMTVVDYMPAGGWYTRLLVPYLGEDGHYIALNPDVSGASDGQREMLGDLAGRFPAKAAAWTGVPEARIAAFNTDGLPPALSGTVDRVLIFRELHNLQRFGWLPKELAAVRGLLKDDGLLGIVEHRAKPGAPDGYADGSKGYMKEADVVRLVEQAGFELVGKSEVNANPRDSADYPAGVWSLPPTYALGDENRTGFAAIGESDRMTLLFRKRR